MVNINYLKSYVPLQMNSQIPRYFSTWNTEFYCEIKHGGHPWDGIKSFSFPLLQPTGWPERQLGLLSLLPMSALISLHYYPKPYTDYFTILFKNFPMLSDHTLIQSICRHIKPLSQTCSLQSLPSSLESVFKVLSYRSCH